MIKEIPISTWWMSYKKRELLTLGEYLGSLMVFFGWSPCCSSFYLFCVVSSYCAVPNATFAFRDCPLGFFLTFYSPMGDQKRSFHGWVRQITLLSCIFCNTLRKRTNEILIWKLRMKYKALYVIKAFCHVIMYDKKVIIYNQQSKEGHNPDMLQTSWHI